MNTSIHNNKLNIMSIKNINYCYLYVPGSKGIGGYNGLEKIKFSIDSLKKYSEYDNIYVYCGNDGTDIDEIPKMKKYCNENKIIFIDIGTLKHDFGRINKHITIKNPYRLNILIEKVYILLNHSDLENIVVLDIDNVLQHKLSIDIFTDMNALLAEKENNYILNVRNLKEAFDEMNISINDKTPYYNSGFIYIPKKNRKKIAKEIIDMILTMNRFDDKKRIAKDLDEQIAVSSIIYKYYNNNIQTVDKYFKHYWIETVNNINYWETYNVGFIVSNNTYNQLKQLQDIKKKDNFNTDPNNLLNGEIYSLSCWIYALMDSTLKYTLIKLSDHMLINKAKLCKNIVFYFTYCKDLHNKLLKKTNTIKYFNHSYFEKKNNKDDLNILTTYYNNNYNISLGIYPHPISQKTNNINFNNNIHGLIWSKCVSHWVDHSQTGNILNFIEFMKDKNIFLYTTLRNIKNIEFPKYLKKEKKDKYYDTYDQINNFNNINNLQQTNITNFRELLNHVKFVIGFGVPGSGPTIVECLHTKTLLLCPSIQVPVDLQNNTNIILTDNMSLSEMTNIIINIINGNINFDNTDIPYRYTKDGVKTKMYDTFSIIKNNDIEFIKNKDISICYISWKKHNVLENTLKNHLDNNLYKFVNNKIIFFQEYSQIEQDIAIKFNLDCIYNYKNVNIYGGFKELVLQCENKYMIFSENDFIINCDKNHIINIFKDIFELFENDNIDIVRLRNLSKPGYPFLSKTYTNSIKYSDDLYNANKYSKCFNHSLESLNWLNEPEKTFTFLNVIQKRFKWYYTKQKNINWTNNIYITKTKILKEIILPLFKLRNEECIKESKHLNMEYYLDNLEKYSINCEDTTNLIVKYNMLNTCTTFNGMFEHKSN